MSDQKQTQPSPEKPADPYQKYKDFKWQNPDQFKNGPIDDESRKCRDCVCCIIFILLFALFIVVAAFGFWKGQPSKLLYFYDDTGHACGHDEGYENYPYLCQNNVCAKDFKSCAPSISCGENKLLCSDNICRENC